MREEFDAEADELERDLPRLGSYPVPGLVRRARRIADLSQRQLARRAGVSPATVGRVESGEIMPTLGVLQRLLAVAGIRLVPVDEHGRIVEPMRESGLARDLAGRRFPAHLDTVLAPDEGEWWLDVYGFARRPDFYNIDRDQRDWVRQRRRAERQGQPGPSPPPSVRDKLDIQRQVIDDAWRAGRPPEPQPTEEEWEVDEWDPHDMHRAQ